MTLKGKKRRYRLLNKIIIMGRLTRDPELRRTGSGTAVTSFSLAVDRDFKSQNGEKETDFMTMLRPVHGHSTKPQSGKSYETGPWNGNCGRA